MMSVSDLAGRFIDGDLSSAEQAELAQALDRGDAALETYRLGWEVEFALRRTVPERDLAAKVMQALERAREERIVRRTTDEIGRRAPWNVSSRRRRRWPAFVAAAAAMAALYVLAFRKPSLESSRPYVVEREEERSLAPSRSLPAENVPVWAPWSETAPTTATLHLGTATTIRLSADASHRVPKAGETLVVLDGGRLVMEAAEPPSAPILAVMTPHARVDVRAARLTLTVRATDTRLEVTAGRVAFTAFSDGVTKVVSALQSVDASGDPSSQSKGATAIIRFDFEGGELPSGIRRGQLVAGPVRARSRFSVRGTVTGAGQFPDATVVAVEAPRGTALFSSSPRLTLGFDYWVARGPSARLMVRVKEQDSGLFYVAAVNAPARGRWTHVEIPISRFRFPLSGRALADGDQVVGITISLGKTLLYVDDIEVTESADPPR